MIKIIRIYGLMSLFALLNHTFSGSLYAQSCEEKLQMAEGLFAQGLVERLPGLLFPCMEEGFTKEQKIRAYKLMILAYYFDDAMDEAHKTMHHFIRTFPNYIPDSTDSPRFVSLFESFENKRFISVGFQAGTHYPFPTFMNPSSGYSHDMLPEDSYPYESFSYRTGISVHLFLSRHMDLSLDVMYGSTLIRNERTIDLGNETADLSYKENYTAVDFPLYFSYHFSQKRVQPYLVFGSHISYRIKSTASIDLYSSEGTSFQETDIDVTHDRYTVASAALLGGGVKIMQKKSCFFIELRYIQGISNFFSVPESISTEELTGSFNNNMLWNYLYDNDRFKLGQASVMIGYRLYFNKIRPR